MFNFDQIDENLNNETANNHFIDEQKFKDFIESELNRKEKFSEWQQLYIEKNEDVEEAKELMREESRRTLETSMPQPVESDFQAKNAKRKSTITGAKPK